MKLLPIITLIATVALAQQPTPDINPNAVQFIVACGSSSGTYEALLDELQPFVAEQVQFKKSKSSGAVENLDQLISNQVQGAFMHSDVIEFRKRAGKDMSKFKTLLALHKEEIHLLALTESKRTSGRFYNRKPVMFNTLDDLAGYKVGAAGGGYITAMTIKAMTMIPFEVVQYPSGKDVINALNKGDIECALFVGGAPLPNLKDLGPEYKLLSIPESRMGQLQLVYTPANVTYTKMRPEAVNTMAADCLFVAQDYKTPRFRNAMKQIRTRFYQILDELKETPGDHAKWQEVDPANHGKWTWMELP
jgi:TRAP-type uncharacterized transport system substrate-binding protein